MENIANTYAEPGHALSPVDDADLMWVWDVSTSTLCATPKSVLLTELNASITALGATDASLQSQINGLGSGGGLLRVEGSTVLTANTTTDLQLSNLPADATISMASNDAIISVVYFNLVNTSGVAATFTLQQKTAGNVTFAPPAFSVATGGAYFCALFLEYVQGTLNPNTDHKQTLWFEISGPYASIALAGTTAIPSWVASTRYAVGQSASSGGTDYGMTQPQVEFRFHWNTAAATLGCQKVRATYDLKRGS